MLATICWRYFEELLNKRAAAKEAEKARKE